MKRALIALLLSAIVVASASERPTWKTSLTKTGKANISVRYPVFTGKVSRLATAAIKSEFDRLSGAFRKEYSKGNGTDRDSTMDLEAQVAISNPDLCSTWATLWTYTGGAHPMAGYEVFNFGLVHGKPARLTLQSLFRPGISAQAVLEPLILGKLLQQGAAWVEDGSLRELGDLLKLFVIKKDRLNFLIPPYAAGPWSQGTFEIEVPFSEIRRELDPKGPLKGLLR